MRLPTPPRQEPAAEMSRPCLVSSVPVTQGAQGLGNGEEGDYWCGGA